MKKYSSILTVAALLCTMISCSKWDDFKQYTAEGETLYTGKIDSVKINPGRLRVQMTGLLPADPKIVKCVITWNDGKDSVVFPINKSGVSGVFNQTFAVNEGLKNFRIKTYDAEGNSSVAVQATGMVYGPNYESGLVNRPIGSAELLSSGNTVINWDAIDTSSGAKGTYVWYKDVNNADKSVFTPVSQSVTTLPNYKPGSTFQYSTMYLPSVKCIDTFYSAKQTAGVKYDVTATYIKNAGTGFANIAGGNDRWQTPADWITTADVRNGGNNIGGLDNGSWLPSKALSIEAWWGMTPIPNGKIYQTFTLPAGKYAYTATTGDCSSGGTKYMSVSGGTSLPDIANVMTQAIAYKSVAKFADNTITFKLDAPTVVSLGIQAGMTAEGNFMKVFKVRLYSLP